MGFFYDNDGFAVLEEAIALKYNVLTSSQCARTQCGSFSVARHKFNDYFPDNCLVPKVSRALVHNEYVGAIFVGMDCA